MENLNINTKEMVYDMLKCNGFRIHHIASARGYVSRKPNSPANLEKYKGRFGIGYKLHLPRYDTTRYHTVIYFIKEG